VAVKPTPAVASVRTRTLLGIAIFVFTVGLYLPVCAHDWLNYDDTVYVTQSDPVRAGWSGDSVVWAFTSFDGANWFPLTRLSWMLDVQLYGLEAGPFLLTNVLLHALTSLVLFLALARLTGGIWPSAFVAAVFALHPLHVESVAWIAARKDPLSGLFWMLALLLYASEADRGASRARRAGLFACVALGLLAKATVVTLPFVLLLLDAWPLGRLGKPNGRGVSWPAVRGAVVEKLPLFALVAAFSLVTFLAQQSAGAVASLERVALVDRFANAVSSYATYLGKAFWPTGLAVFYPHRGADGPGVTTALGLVLLLSLSLVAWRERQRRPYLAVGWLWFLGTLVPVIGIVQVGSQALADRYMYLPLIGLGIAVAWSAADFCAGAPRRRVAVAAAGCAALAALALTTSAQIRHWQDSASLFRHALSVTDDNHVAHTYLGTALLTAGKTGEAIVEYRTALSLRPDQLTVANNLAWLLATGAEAIHRDPAGAVEFSERAAALAGGEDPAVLDTLAAAYASAGRFEEATATAERAIALARRGGRPALAAEIGGRLALYRARRAYVERPTRESRRPGDPR